jgi:hypothetical protein
MENIGRRVRVNLSTGETVEGWVYGQTILGDYIALDRAGTSIRFVPRGMSRDTLYSDEGNVLFPHQVDVEAYRALSREWREPLSLALDRIDQNRIKRLVRQDQQLASSLRFLKRFYEERTDYQLPPFFRTEYLIDSVLETRDTHRELLDEISRAGLKDILLESHEQIRHVISHATLPQLDAAVVPRHELEEMIALVKEQDQLSETDLGARYNARLSTRSIVSAIERTEEVPESRETEESKQTEEEPTPEKSKSRKGRRLRIVAAWLKVAAGTGMAATNIALGAAAGIATAIPTLGMGTVGAAVGVIASAFTGLNSASDGLDKVGTIQSEQEKEQEGK